MNQYGFVDIVLLSGFANYFNRKIFYYNTLQDYLDHSEDSEEKNDINFNPADGVNAVLDVNVDDDRYQYLLVVDHETGDILSRWWIIEADRNLSGQYRLTLRRDVVAESFGSQEFMLKSPIYVEKGILSDEDPFIVNSEGMNFNQIKKGEKLITTKDDYGNDIKVAYIIGYVENGSSVSSYIIPAARSTTGGGDEYSVNDIAAATGIDETELANLFSSNSPITFATSDFNIVFGMNIQDELFNPWRIECIIRNQFMSAYGRSETPAFWSNPIGLGRQPNNFNIYINSNSFATVKAALQDVINNDYEQYLYLSNQLSSLLSYDGKKITIGGTVYTMSFSTSGESSHEEVVISKGENSFFDNAINATADVSQTNDWELYLNYKIKTVNCELTPVRDGSFKTKISSSHNVLMDAPFSIFAIPYGDSSEYDVYDGDHYENSLITKEDALKIGTSLAEKLGAKLYDLQLLPFYPEAEIQFERGQGLEIWIQNLVEGKDYDIIYAIDNGVDKKSSVILYPSISNFSFTIQDEITLTDKPKIESQCNFYRLCSPNYSGVFEFNLAKNGGKINYFNVNCTYKPINPFIRITPEFNFLYGGNYLDGRGLICGGDFSLPIIKDAWIAYEQNNKNYAAIFARDIQNLDVAQKQERLKENISLGAGIVGGGATGAVAGGKIGGGYGAIAGAAIGTGLGAAGAVIDSYLGQQRRAEAKDYLIDRFNLNLANIRAIPDSLARNSAFTLINKIFPFIEYYSCTDEEKEALKQKIKYDGMTVGRIGNIVNYMSASSAAEKNYFKGQLIRAEGINEDNHFVNALYEEIAKGVYI